MPRQIFRIGTRQEFVRRLSSRINKEVDRIKDEVGKKLFRVVKKMERFSRQFANFEDESGALRASIETSPPQSVNDEIEVSISAGPSPGASNPRTPEGGYALFVETLQFQETGIGVTGRRFPIADLTASGGITDQVLADLSERGFWVISGGVLAFIDRVPVEIGVTLEGIFKRVGAFSAQVDLTI